MIKVINPDVEIWKQEGYTLEAIWKHIARCARVCYQSTPRAKDESSYDFVKRTLLHGVDVLHNTYNLKDIESCHLSVLEHGTIHLKFHGMLSSSFSTFNNVFKHNKYSKYYIKDEYIYVTTNMRVIVEQLAIGSLAVIDTTPNSPYYFNRTTFSFITNIGVSRELNRHRCHSISEESSRYCAYDKDKFGNNITITKVPWIKYLEYENKVIEANPEVPLYTDDWTAVDWYCYGLEVSNLVYRKLREFGWQAQQARDVLPLATKTQVVHTAYNADWLDWIDLRANEISGKVHPEMKELAIKVKELMK